MDTVRELNEEEQKTYSRAVVNAVSYVPTFRDSIALLRPFFDPSANSLYTDEYARVGIGPWFFTIDSRKQASLILHECMHVLNNHFVRAKEYDINGFLINLAGDFEINSGLDILPDVDLSEAVFPDKFPFSFQRYLSFEQYCCLLIDQKNKCEKSLRKSEIFDDDVKEKLSDNGTFSCDDPVDATDRADQAGVERATNVEMSVAQRNTRERIRDDINNNEGSIGQGHMSQFLNFAQKMMNPPKVPWASILKRTLARSYDTIANGRSDYSFRRMNRRAMDGPYIVPGMVSYTPRILVGVDTSASMQEKDFMAILSEIESIVRNVGKNKKAVKMFSIDTEVQNVITVSSMRDIKFKGGGGTDMSIALDYLSTLHSKDNPDIFVLVTDGYTDWDIYFKKLQTMSTKIHNIIVITTDEGYNEAISTSHMNADILNISDSKSL